MTITHDVLDLTVQSPPLDMGPHCTGTSPQPWSPIGHGTSLYGDPSSINPGSDIW